MTAGLRLAALALAAVLAGLAVPLLRPAPVDKVARPILSAVPAAPADAAELKAPASAAPATVRVPAGREAIRQSFSPIVKRVAPAVVNVYATAQVEVRSPFEGDPFFERFFGGGSPFGPFEAPRRRARSSLGSGVIVDASGLVVTNNHVIQDATEVKVALSDGREFQANILLRDERSDLAVLRMENGDGEFPVLSFADSDQLEVGDLVLAVGNPFGVGQTVTSGIVSAVARTNIGIRDSGFFIQTDAAINPGNSGGALVDLDGAVIGINTAIFSRSGGSIGIGFAIPSNMVRIVVAQAAAGSSTVARAWIGALSQDVTPEIAASLGLTAPNGALVTQVDEDSPAGKAGLRVGDLILAAGGRSVGNPSGLDYRLTVTGIGNPVELDVWRDGEKVAITVVPEAEPELDEHALTTLAGNSPLTGAVVVDLSTAVADRLNLRGARAGVAIVDIEPRSPAARVGFRPGDVVVQAQGEKLKTARQLQDLVESGGGPWRITLNRDGKVSNLVIGG